MSVVAKTRGTRGTDSAVEAARIGTTHTRTSSVLTSPVGARVRCNTTLWKRAKDAVADVKAAADERARLLHSGGGGEQALH